MKNLKSKRSKSSVSYANIFKVSFVSGAHVSHFFQPICQYIQGGTCPIGNKDPETV
uniref:Uncharacterized protein n=1 Tax=viral metagenome TaxID=1070528 RepID=A0A6C0J3C3_9ZZZZ